MPDSNPVLRGAPVVEFSIGLKGNVLSPMQFEMRTKNLIVIFLSIFCIACSGSDTSTAQYNKYEKAYSKAGIAFQARLAHARRSDAVPFLWKVMGPSDVKPSYLFGTIHQFISRKQIKPVVWQALDASSTIVFENKLGVSAVAHYSPDDAPAPIFPSAPEGAFSKTELAKNIPMHFWRHLTNGLNDVQKEKLKFATPMFAASVFNSRFSDGVGKAVDIMLLERVLFSCKFPRALESEQETMTEADFTAKNLLFSMENVDASLSWTADVLDAWLSGDSTAVLQVIDRSPFPSFRVKERNAAWLPKIEQHIAIGDAFIAVGTAHLIGENGIVESLRKNGYKVERVQKVPTKATKSNLNRKYWCDNGSHVVRNYMTETPENGWVPTEEGKSGNPNIICSKDGMMDGPVVLCYGDEQLMLYNEVRKNKPNGPTLIWFENGQLGSRGHFLNGVPDGLQQAWHENGRLASEVTYDMGEQKGQKKEWPAEDPSSP